MEIIVNQCPSLYKLKLEDNEIASIDKLKCLSKLKLKKIYVKGNPLIEANKEYQENLFSLFENLLSIDGKNKEEKDVESTEFEEDGEEEFPENEDDEESEDDVEGLEKEEEGLEDEKEKEKGKEGDDEKEVEGKSTDEGGENKKQKV